MIYNTNNLKKTCDNIIGVDPYRFVRTIFLEVIAAVLVICFSNGISGNDFWWHIKVGEYICQNQTIPTSDIFSWLGIEKGLPWTAHEWLSEVVFCGIFTVAGEKGIFCFCFIAALIMMVLIYKETKDHIMNNPVIGGLYITLLAVITSTFFYGRPHIFGFFILFFELKILYGFMRKPDTKSIFVIPVLAVLWSNLHGGSSNLSYIFCFAFLGTAALNIKFGRIQSKRLDKKALLRLGCVSFATMGAILVNPIGFRVFIYPYQNLSDSVSMNYISEWQSPDAKQIGQLILYFAIIALITVGMIAYEKKIDLIDIVVMAMFLFLFLRSVRFVILWYIAVAFYGLKYMPGCRISKIKHFWEKAAVIVCESLLVIAVSYGMKKTKDTLSTGEIISKSMSHEAVEAVKSDAPKRIFNDYNVGDALIYNEIPVFFDARADLFARDNILADGFSLLYLHQINPEKKGESVVVDDMLEKYDIDAVIVQKIRPLYSYIISHPERFLLVYGDSEIAYFRIK